MEVKETPAPTFDMPGPPWHGARALGAPPVEHPEPAR